MKKVIAFLLALNVMMSCMWSAFAATENDVIGVYTGVESEMGMTATYTLELKNNNYAVLSVYGSGYGESESITEYLQWYLNGDRVNLSVNGNQISGIYEEDRITLKGMGTWGTDLLLIKAIDNEVFTLQTRTNETDEKSKWDIAFESGQVTLCKVVPDVLSRDDIEFVISDAAAAYYGIENKYSVIAQLYDAWDPESVVDGLRSMSPDGKAFIFKYQFPMILHGNQAFPLYVSRERGQKDWYDDAYTFVNRVFSSYDPYQFQWSPDGRYVSFLLSYYSNSKWSIPFLIDVYTGEIILPGIHMSKSLNGLIAACFSEDSRYFYYVLCGTPSEYGERSNDYFEKHVNKSVLDESDMKHWIMCYDIVNDIAYPIMNVEIATLEKYMSGSSVVIDEWVPEYPEMYCIGGKLYMHCHNSNQKNWKEGIVCVYNEDDEWKYASDWLYEKNFALLMSDECEKVLLSWNWPLEYIKVLSADGMLWNNTVYYLSNGNIIDIHDDERLDSSEAEKALANDDMDGFSNLMLSPDKKYILVNSYSSPLIIRLSDMQTVNVALSDKWITSSEAGADCIWYTGINGAGSGIIGSPFHNAWNVAE